MGLRYDQLPNGITVSSADIVSLMQNGVTRRSTVGQLGAAGTFTQNATGAVVGDEQSKLREVLSFEDFGAVGDGVTNDSTAINLATAWLRTNVSTSVAPSGFTFGLCGTTGKIYRVNGSINATGIAANNWFIDLRGSMILGRCNGQPVLDMLGSRFGRFYGLNIYGHATDTPTYGIQMGRVSSASAGEVTFVDLRTDGFFTNAAYYNYAGEICTFLHPQIWNRGSTSGAYAYILDARNEQNITSAFITQTNAQGTARSCNGQTFIDADFRTGGGIPCARLIGNFNEFECQGYMAASSGTSIEVYKSTSINNLDLDVHFETTGLSKCITFDTVDASSNPVISGFSIRDYNPYASTALMDTTGTTRTLVIDGARMTFGIPTGGPPIIFGGSSGASSKVQITGVIEWLSNTALDLSNITFDGHIITRGTAEVTITDTVGCYDVIRRPSSQANRVHLHKGEFRVTGTNTNTAPANYVELVGTATGSDPSVTAGGSDTDVDLLLGGQGAGLVKLGTHSNITTETLSGFITIKDAAGNTRKIGVVS